MRWQPISVYCLHHISDDYDPLTMWKDDWISAEFFKNRIQHLQANGVEFISLTEAYEKLKNDRFRSRRFAVLTADDGYKSLLSIMPWLEEQRIPITIFVNTRYLDGKSWCETNEQQAKSIKQDADMLTEVCPKLYLTEAELKQVAAMSNVTIGMHGHEHLDATKQTIEEFEQNVDLCHAAIKDVSHTIPYFAYPWGLHNTETDDLLCKKGLIPVFVSGTENFNNNYYIDRQLLQ